MQIINKRGYSEAIDTILVADTTLIFSEMYTFNNKREKSGEPSPWTQEFLLELGALIGAASRLRDSVVLDG